MDVHYVLCENHYQICVTESSIWAELSLTVELFLLESLPTRCSSTFLQSPLQSASQKLKALIYLKFQVTNLNNFQNLNDIYPEQSWVGTNVQWRWYFTKILCSGHKIIKQKLFVLFSIIRSHTNMVTKVPTKYLFGNGMTSKAVEQFFLKKVME